MFDLIKTFRALLNFNKLCIDNNVFRMHYEFTVIMLVVLGTLVTFTQFFGEPIHCMSNGEEDAEHEVINSYCWIYGTYTLKSRLPGQEGHHNTYPGIGPSIEDDDEQIKHTYYQWVWLVLLVQAVMFYTPHYLWKVWEGGHLKALASDLSSPLVPKEWAEYRREELVSYLCSTHTYTHNMYALCYAFCELLNLINVIIQIFLLDMFLGGAFRSYGLAVAVFTHTPRVPFGQETFESVNPMDQFFPKLTKCWLRNYGPSSTIQFKDRLCVLPLNIINEKIFVILWFWIIILSIASFLAILFRVLVYSLSCLRTMMIMGQLRYVKRSVVSRVVNSLGYGDWFLLYLLGNNMNPIVYKELIIELHLELFYRLERTDNRAS